MKMILIRKRFDFGLQKFFLDQACWRKGKKLEFRVYVVFKYYYGPELPESSREGINQTERAARLQDKAFTQMGPNFGFMFSLDLRYFCESLPLILSKELKNAFNSFSLRIMHREGTIVPYEEFVFWGFFSMYSLGSEWSEVYPCDIHVPREGKERLDRKCLKPLLTLMFTSSLEAKGKSVYLQK